MHLDAHDKFHAYGVHFAFELGFNLGCGSVMLATEVALRGLRAQKNRLSSVYDPLTLMRESGGRGRIRTSDRLVRSQVLYPAELRVRSVMMHA